MFRYSIKKLILVSLFQISLFLFCSCTEKNGAVPNIKNSKAYTENSGALIVFPDDSPSLSEISAIAVHPGKAIISVKAPSRVVAEISNAVTTTNRIILFDNPEITSLYSQYKQFKTNINLYTNNLKRLKELLEIHSTTAKELNQQENELMNAQTTLAELEIRLRSAGFNPIELENSGPKAIWLISDVPESELNEVQNGEEVDVNFNSFAGKKFKGKVVSIGDVIDPVTRTIKVRSIIKNYNEKIIPGMYAQVDFGDEESNVVLLKSSALVSVEGKDYIFVKTDKFKFERRQVIVKKSGSDEVIITKGINDNDNVVVKGAILLKGLSFGY